MTAGDPKFSALTVVALGAFSPRVFHPSWFAIQGLITHGEADSAQLQITHPDISIFSTDYWDFECIPERISFSSARLPNPEILRDLVVGTLGALGEIPLSALGLNRATHWDMAPMAKWHAFGHRLVPPNNWSDLDSPGMKSVTVQGTRPDGHDGHVLVKVEPSTTMKYGVFVEVNDHFQLTKSSEDLGGIEKAIQILTESWEDSLDRSMRITRSVISGEQG